MKYQSINEASVFSLKFYKVIFIQSTLYNKLVVLSEKKVHYINYYVFYMNHYTLYNDGTIIKFKIFEFVISLTNGYKTMYIKNRHNILNF